MNDDGPQFSLCTLLAAASWLATLTLLVLAWVVWSLDLTAHPHMALLIAETACVLSAVAAVLQIRCYARQTTRLIRLTTGLQRQDADVREFSPRR